MNNVCDLHEYRQKWGKIGPSYLLNENAWWPIIFIVFFETVLGREHSGKVSKKFIGNFYFWGITLRTQHNVTGQGWNPDLSIRRRAHLSRRPPRLHSHVKVKDTFVFRRSTTIVILESKHCRVLENDWKWLFLSSIVFTYVVSLFSGQ